MFKMNLLPTIWSSSSLIVSVGNNKTANLPYQAPINDIKPIVLAFQSEALTNDIKPFDWKFETAHLPYEAPTYDIKPFELNRQYEIADQLYRTSTYDIKPLVLDFRNEALAYDIKPIGWKIWNRRPTRSGPGPRYQSPHFSLSIYSLELQYIRPELQL